MLRLLACFGTGLRRADSEAWLADDGPALRASEHCGLANSVWQSVPACSRWGGGGGGGGGALLVQTAELACGDQGCGGPHPACQNAGHHLCHWPEQHSSPAELLLATEVRTRQHISVAIWHPDYGKSMGPSLQPDSEMQRAGAGFCWKESSSSCTTTSRAGPWRRRSPWTGS